MFDGGRIEEDLPPAGAQEGDQPLERAPDPGVPGLLADEADFLER